MNKNFNISGTLLLTVILLLTAACSSDISNDPQPTNGQQEISLNPTVWQYHRTGLAKLRSTLHGTTRATPLLVIH